MDAHDRANVAAFARCHGEDVRQSMPPYLFWYAGRDAVATVFARFIDPGSPDYPGHLRLLPTGANLQPAVVGYLRGPGDRDTGSWAFPVLSVDQGQIAEIVWFGTDFLDAFGQQQTLRPRRVSPPTYGIGSRSDEFRTLRGLNR